MISGLLFKTACNTVSVSMPLRYNENPSAWKDLFILEPGAEFHAIITVVVSRPFRNFKKCCITDMKLHSFIGEFF